MIRFNCCDREYIVTDNSKILVHEHVFNLYHYSNRNLSIEYTLSLLENLASKGYDIIVDLTPYSKVWNYYEIIEKSPVNIISCVGFFTGKYLSFSEKNKDEKYFFNKMENQIKYGIGRKKIKPGIIKIATNSNSLLPYEKNIFSAAANISIIYGLPIAVHAPKSGINSFEYLVDKGVNPNKIMICHAESAIVSKTLDCINEIKLILQKGGFVQFSNFGTSNSKRRKIMINICQSIINSQFKNQLLLSNDFSWKWKNNVPIPKKNISNYLFIENEIIPDFLSVGINEEEVFTLMHRNPIIFLHYTKY